MSSRVAELFGKPTSRDCDWAAVVASQDCPFTSKRCFKVRKSDPSISIGTCTVRAGRALTPVIICPNRLRAGGQVFTDALHLLADHQSGDELHVVSEVQIPGGSVDYFVVSTRDGRAVDFVGVEFQALDTTGTVWPHRQAFLAEHGLASADEDERSFGVNWKMTAKTILVQLHHKIKTFEAVERKLVLVLQDELLRYMTEEFSFGHLADGSLEDSMHFHAYRLAEGEDGLGLSLADQKSTDAAGIAVALTLGQPAEMEIETMLLRLEAKMGTNTRWEPSEPTKPEPIPDVEEDE